MCTRKTSAGVHGIFEHIFERKTCPSRRSGGWFISPGGGIDHESKYNLEGLSASPLVHVSTLVCRTQYLQEVAARFIPRFYYEGPFTPVLEEEKEQAKHRTESAAGDATVAAAAARRGTPSAAEGKRWEDREQNARHLRNPSPSSGPPPSISTSSPEKNKGNFLETSATLLAARRWTRAGSRGTGPGSAALDGGGPSTTTAAELGPADEVRKHHLSRNVILGTRNRFYTCCPHDTTALAVELLAHGWSCLWLPSEGFVFGRPFIFHSPAAASFPHISCTSSRRIGPRVAPHKLSTSLPRSFCTTTKRGPRFRTLLEEAQQLGLRGTGQAALSGPGRRSSPPAQPLNIFFQNLAGERQAVARRTGVLSLKLGVMDDPLLSMLPVLYLKSTKTPRFLDGFEPMRL